MVTHNEMMFDSLAFKYIHFKCTYIGEPIKYKQPIIT